MSRFSHIKWYEWVLFGLFSFEYIWVLIQWSFRFNDSFHGSPFIPVYAFWYVRIKALSMITQSIIGVLGITLIWYKKPLGWSLAAIALLISLLKLITLLFIEIPSNFAFYTFASIIIGLYIYGIAFLFFKRIRAFANPGVPTYILVIVISSLLAYLYLNAMNIAIYMCPFL